MTREALRAEVSDAINSILRSVVPLSALDNATDRILAAFDRAPAQPTCTAPELARDSRGLCGSCAAVKDGET